VPRTVFTRGYFPGGWGPPHNPTKPPVHRQWTRGTSHSEVLCYAAQVWNTLPESDRNDYIPDWFLAHFGLTRSDLRAKITSLNYWRRLLVTITRFEYYRFKIGEYRPITVGLGITPRRRFKNLPAALRTVVRRTGSPLNYLASDISSRLVLIRKCGFKIVLGTTAAV